MNRLSLLLLMALLTACSRHEANLQKEISLSFDGTLDWSSVSESSSYGESKHETFIEGMKYWLDLEKGTLHIGEESFSGLVPGDEVMIGGEGILVNGVHRWNLPQPDQN